MRTQILEFELRLNGDLSLTWGRVRVLVFMSPEKGRELSDVTFCFFATLINTHI